jgi:serine protease Do
MMRGQHSSPGRPTMFRVCVIVAVAGGLLVAGGARLAAQDGETASDAPAQDAPAQDAPTLDVPLAGAALGDTPLLGAVEEEIRLSNGAAVRGRVLKETEDNLFIDVGYTVLEVPRASIVGRAALGPGTQLAGDEVVRGLYSQASLPEVSVKEAVERFAEGVVQIKVPGALGSGFLVSDDGYVITNAHVVQGEVEVSVVIFPQVGDQIDKETISKVKLVAINPVLDLALLKIDEAELKGRKLTKVYLGDTPEVRVGETVFAIGSPLGLERSVSEGVISTKTRAMNGHIYLQTTAPINPGNSGGPLFNTKGQVVGVNSLKVMFSDGLGFAIPVDEVKRFIENREAFAFDRENPNSGYRYLPPPRRGK